MASGAPVARQAVQQRVLVEVLPPVRQPTEHAAPSRDALTVVTVTITPTAPGREVVLQRREGEEKWRPSGYAATNRRGVATFFVPSVRPALPVSYRARAASHRGLTGQRSAGSVLDMWGRPRFVDEFDGDLLSTAWEHRIQFYNPWGGRSCSKGSPAAVTVAGGVLRLSSMIDPDATSECTPTDADGIPLGPSYPYRLNGHVSTQHSADFLYGVAAARMRFPQSMGQHASFWLQPRGLLETGPTPWGAEIDVIEWYGNNGRISRMASVVHEPLPDGQKHEIGGPILKPDRFLDSRSDKWWTRFHVFSVEWTPREYIFRISGHEVWRTSQGVSDYPEFLILSLLSSDFELPAVGADPTPRIAEIDWVAFWQEA